MRDLPQVRMIIMTALAFVFSACASVPAEQTRLTEARSMSRQHAETMIDSVFASLSRSGVLNDIDCSQETGIDAKQCIAFTARMASRMEQLKTEERKIALTDAADGIEALAQAMASLSEPDFSTLRILMSPAPESAIQLSAGGRDVLEQPTDSLFETLMAADARAADRVEALVMEIITELMADPAFQ